ncbi:UDP-N-acetylmuramate dehydrogenase [Azospirillum sp. ST 5-10]|uniref:UDP-N-acetylmuramate dehydrogenase n=1 Tax=unclassified Azospirillum TaxID=2630922 RepID=UPI003F4A5285
MAQPHLIDRMPRCRGRLTADAPLANVTWFRVGGPAEVMFRPADADDLAEFLAALPAEVPVTVLGVASNLLIRDGGIPGVTIRLGRGFAGIDVAGTVIAAGAAALDVNVAAVARDNGLAGLEFLSGIPGTIGGAVRMNAGAYGAEIKDVLLAARALDRRGQAHSFSAEAMGFRYRGAAAPDDLIFVSATLQGFEDEPIEIQRRMAEIAAQRGESQPVRTRTGGSTFKNPPGGRKAWQYIDEAGCRGLRVGDAQVSELHCNFLLNLGSASAADLEALGEEVRRRVREASGVELEWEIKRLGIAKGAE